MIVHQRGIGILNENDYKEPCESLFSENIALVWYNIMSQSLSRKQ